MRRLDRYDIYMTGVGGQGIGLLAEALARSIDFAGLRVKGCDTHGLAQRGGIVASHLRIGADVHSPLVSPLGADLVLALERTEALRAALSYLKPGGTLVFYDADWQPLPVRMGETPAVETAWVEEACRALDATAVRVFRPDLADPRMQNTAILAELAQRALPPGVRREHYAKAMDSLMGGKALEANLALLGA